VPKTNASFAERYVQLPLQDERMSMSHQKRLFLILWLAGMSGVLSFLLVDLPRLIDLFPLPPDVEKPTVTPLLKFGSLIQPAILLAVAVFIGTALARKVRLSSPVAEALASGRNAMQAFRPQWVPGLVGGISGGIAIVAIALIWKPFLPPDVVARVADLGNLLPIPTRILYGGFTEELLLRWGFMTLLVWIPWRSFQKREGVPKPLYVISAILISSFVFAIGHLPIASMLVPKLTIALTSYAIAANSAFGLIAGYLYWKKGLESAILAHMLTHVVLISASYSGAYF
jgi:hypothetical protein